MMKMPLKLKLEYLWLDISHPFYLFWEWVVKSIQYSALLWDDRDYDWTSILRLLEFKLARTRETIKNGHHDNGESKRIRTCELLIRRILDDEYDKLPRLLHEKRWGKTEFDWDSSTLDVIYEKVLTEEQKKQEKREFNDLLTRSNTQRKQDLDYLFSIMARRIQSWWD